MERYDVCSDGTLMRAGEGKLLKFADAQRALDALQAQLAAMTESRDAWKLSQECSEKAYMLLATQIPSERYDYDPVNLALLDGAKEQERIGRKQIADLQAQLRQVEGERDTARHRVDELEAREIDVEILQGDLRALRAENARFRAVLMNMQAAWNNKNEVTSVYVWNERMMAAMADVDAALRPERGRND